LVEIGAVEQERDPVVFLRTVYPFLGRQAYERCSRQVKRRGGTSWPPREVPKEERDPGGGGSWADDKAPRLRPPPA
jgi:hypothetical protein